MGDNRDDLHRPQLEPRLFPDGCHHVLFNSVSIRFIHSKIIAIASSWVLVLAAATASVPSLNCETLVDPGGLRNDSISRVDHTASSTLVGFVCLTLKATWGLSSCDKYWFSANCSLASSGKSGYALSAKFFNSSPNTAHPSFCFFLRIYNSLLYSSFLLSGSNRLFSASVARVKSALVASGNCRNAIPALPDRRTRSHFSLAAAFHPHTWATQTWANRWFSCSHLMLTSLLSEKTILPTTPNVAALQRPTS